MGQVNGGSPVRARKNWALRVGVGVFLLAAVGPLATHVVLKATAGVRGDNPLLVYVARAAQGRVLQKLASPEGPWRDAVAGRPLPGYRNDKDFDDIRGGLYQVLVTAGPVPGQVTVRVRARSSFSGDTHETLVTYSRAWRRADALTAAGPFALSNDFHVHWGSLYAAGDVRVSTRPSLTGWPQNGNTHYPRKFSTGLVIPRDSENRGASTDDREYWAGVDARAGTPLLDVAYYRARAAASRVGTTSPSTQPSLAWPRGELSSARGVAVASPAGSGYFPSRLNPGGLTFAHYRWRDPAAVIVVEAGEEEPYTTGLDASFVDVEALVLLGGKHEAWFCAAPGVFRATIPVAAAEEYQHPAAQGIWTMKNPPPAVGGPAFAGVGAGACCYPLPGVTLHGFLHVGGGLAGSGCVNSAVVGAVMVAGDVRGGTWRALTLYGDDEVIRRRRLFQSGPPWAAARATSPR